MNGIETVRLLDGYSFDQSDWDVYAEKYRDSKGAIVYALKLELPVYVESPDSVSVGAVGDYLVSSENGFFCCVPEHFKKTYRKLRR